MSDEYLDILTEEQKKEKDKEENKNKIQFPVTDKQIKFLQEKDKILSEKLNRINNGIKRK